ncbi:YdcF family protein [Cyclobacteriaceae bacterium]|nr:YdcF family protein [Cyclobacteriaceae bacterium]
MVVILLIVIGLYKKRNSFIYFAIALLYIPSTPIFSHAFFKIVEGDQHRKCIANIEQADAIVVLSGMLSLHEMGGKEYIEWGDPDRFFGGITLMKAGKAPNLIFTGAKMPWGKSRRTEGAVLTDHAIQYGIPYDHVFVSSLVTNTADEALAVKKMALGNKIILVTSAFHMPRAQMLFEKEGFEVTPYPVDFKSLNTDSLTFMDYLPNARSLAKTELGLRELIGRLYYWLKLMIN